ncbi:hypothetical protein DMH25_36090 [Streptomyces sp. WAC 01325]|nr:hypothetical protein DMH25_36090 [Streptomyces sp. WAC 01325]
MVWSVPGAGPGWGSVIWAGSMDETSMEGRVVMGVTSMWSPSRDIGRRRVGWDRAVSRLVGS